MFNKIQNPETGKWVNTNGPVGKRVLRNYVRQMGGFGFSKEKTIETIQAELEDLKIQRSQANKAVSEYEVSSGEVPEDVSYRLEDKENAIKKLEDNIAKLEAELEAKKAKQEAKKAKQEAELEAKQESKKAKQKSKKAELEAKIAKLEAKIVQERKLIVDANKKAVEKIKHAIDYTPIGIDQLRFDEMLRFPGTAWKNPAEMEKEDGLLRDDTNWSPVGLQAQKQRAATKRIDRINKEIQKLQTRLSELIPAANAGTGGNNTNSDKLSTIYSSMGRI